jgi:tripartite-type tricarboxylate transporter receptor subunit TctC
MRRPEPAHEYQQEEFMTKRLTARCLIAGAAFACALAAHAQMQWPARAVRIINPFPAGGGVDGARS